MAGIMFKQLAYAVSFALICSLFVALTLVPMLSSRILKPTHLDNPNKKSRIKKLAQASQRFFDKLENNYKKRLHYSLNHRALVLGIIAVLLVYMIMAMLYESVRDPFIVMFSVPMAVIGVVLMLFITNTTFNIQSYIGCIMLGGIVVNNAILLVDYTNLLRNRDKMKIRDAIEEAGRRRLRPILMTATTTIMAMIPLAIGLREGSEAQAPMARAVIGGLISSAFITLVIVPVVYSLFEGRKKKTPTA
ncbi:MAG: efflux RND transporter permease subunit [Acidobacteriota bacterium]